MGAVALSDAAGVPATDADVGRNRRGRHPGQQGLNFPGIHVLSQPTYSGALGVLTGLQMSAQQAGCHIRLVNPTERTAKLLQTTNLIDFFDVSSLAPPK